jgi:hypothetical protein
MVHMSKWIRSVSSTKSPPTRWAVVTDILAVRCAPCPFLLCAAIIGVLVAVYTAGDAPLP